MRGITSLLKEERVFTVTAVAGWWAVAGAVLPGVSSPLVVLVVALEGSVGEKG